RIIRPFTISGATNSDFEFTFAETGFLPFASGENIIFGQDTINGDAGDDILLGQRGGQNILDGIRASSSGDTRDLILRARMFTRFGGSVINPDLDDLITKLIATDGNLTLQGIISLTFFG
ncbi:MAG: hypothetical protein QF473_40905, partial [Planctomycetota bacterium]|nr:hypothetical protein [Planctomycetota bacterium]